MSKGKIMLGITAALVVGASQSWAGSLTVPNSFTSGTTISSSQMNANFSAVKSAVDGNATDITTNKNSITTNTTNITNNTNSITANTTAINTNKANITTNATAITALQGSATCPSDMVQVGDFCIDKYEDSLVDGAGAATTAAHCSVTGNDCSKTAANPIFAQSVAGVLPATTITWFQAAQACANVGKRLPTNQEWQIAAAGTDATQCNLAGATNDKGAVANTDANPTCVSNWGAYDMAGNVAEWVADWLQGEILPVDTVNGTTKPSGTYTNTTPYDGETQDVTPNAASFNTENTGFPVAMSRGGGYSDGAGNAGIFSLDAVSQPSHPYSERGFRCAKNL